MTAQYHSQSVLLVSSFYGHGRFTLHDLSYQPFRKRRHGERQIAASGVSWVKDRFKGMCRAMGTPECSSECFRKRSEARSASGLVPRRINDDQRNVRGGRSFESVHED